MLRTRMDGAIPTSTICLQGVDRGNFTFIKNNIFYQVTQVRVIIEWLSNNGLVQ